MENIVIENMGIKKAVTTSVTAQIKYEGEIERLSLLSIIILHKNVSKVCNNYEGRINLLIKINKIIKHILNYA